MGTGRGPADCTIGLEFRTVDIVLGPGNNLASGKGSGARFSRM